MTFMMFVHPGFGPEKRTVSRQAIDDRPSKQKRRQSGWISAVSCFQEKF
jgi:hypothetical protein